MESTGPVHEDRLWAGRSAGDRAARDLLVKRYMRLAQTLARRYAGSGEPLEDLEQVACIGLVHAVDRFDPRLGNAFTTFAVPTILGELRRHFRDRTWSLRVPRELRDAAITVDRTSAVLLARLGRRPSAAEVAQATGLDIERVVEARHAVVAYRVDSLDRPLYDDGEDGAATVGDRVGTSDAALRRAENGILIDQLTAGALSRRDREVLRLRVHEDLLQREIAERVGISQMQVSRVLRDSVQRLREAAG